MSDEEAKAATRIQAIQRGKEARAEVQELREQTKAATKIQAIQRGKEARAEMEEKKQAAAKIQAIKRGNDARAELEKSSSPPATTNTPSSSSSSNGDGGAKNNKKKKRKKKRLGISILGPTGIGKTEQAKKIADMYDGIYIGSLDEVYEWCVKEKKNAAQEITQARAAGGVISDAAAAHAVGERLAEDDVHKAPAWIVEGFPQNRAQLDELLKLAGGKKSPVSRIISMNTTDSNVLLGRLTKRNELLGENAPELPTSETLGVEINNSEKSWSNIESFSKDYQTMNVSCLNINDASSTADNIFLQLRKYLGPSQREDEAAAKIQAIQRGKEARAEAKAREEAAIKIQAQIRGKEERMHAQRRLEIQNQHDEDEILTAMTSAASGIDGKKIQNIFPRSKKKDLKITTLIAKMNKIKSKDDTIINLQKLIDRPKVIELLTRDFNRRDKKKNLVINYLEFESMVNNHGGKMEERKEKLSQDQIKAIQKEFELRPGAFKELFDDMDVNSDGGVDLEEFREAFAERAELWGYGEAFSAARTKEIGMFEAIDSDRDGLISWKEFNAFMINEKNKKQKENADAAAKIDKKAKELEVQKTKKGKEEKEANGDDDEEEEECEIEILRNRVSGKNNSANRIDGGAVTTNVRRLKNPKRVQVQDSVAQPPVNGNRRTRGNYTQPGRRIVAAPPQDSRPPMGTPDRKIMLVKILRKYRKGLHTTFEFYSKANMGQCKQYTFDQMREEHSGVNLNMFRRLCGDFSLTHNPRAKFDPKAKAVEEMIRPYITKEEIDAIFRRHAQHLKRVSSISHGKGILNEAQFAAAFAQIAVVLLREDPWCDRYPEEWRRVDAIFSRLDVNYNVLLRKRLRGFGGFSIGDGDIGGRKGDRPTVKRPKGFSFNLRLPGDPVTPPPESTRPKRNRLSNTTNANSPDGVLKQAQQAADLDDTKMTVSLAAEFGIDDMSGSGNNPYGTTSSAQYGKFFVLRNF
jgi:adenylate kinase family enzyme